MKPLNDFTYKYVPSDVIDVIVLAGELISTFSKVDAALDKSFFAYFVASF